MNSNYLDRNDTINEYDHASIFRSEGKNTHVGIKNYGNTCYLNSLIQRIARSGRWDHFLSQDVKQHKDEDNSHFKLREKTIKHLRQCKDLIAKQHKSPGRSLVEKVLNDLKDLEIIQGSIYRQQDATEVAAGLRSRYPEISDSPIRAGEAWVYELAGSIVPHSFAPVRVHHPKNTTQFGKLYARHAAPSCMVTVELAEFINKKTVSTQDLLEHTWHEERLLENQEEYDNTPEYIDCLRRCARCVITANGKVVDFYTASSWDREVEKGSGLESTCRNIQKKYPGKSVEFWSANQTLKRTVLFKYPKHLEINLSKSNFGHQNADYLPQKTISLASCILQCEQEDPNNPSEGSYELVDAICRSGNSQGTSGHYWYYHKSEDGQWRKYDDSHVSKRREEDVLRDIARTGYSFMYVPQQDTFVDTLQNIK